MSGHLFITHGNLTSLACDAWALPTDAGGWVSRKWIDDEERLEQLVGSANERGWRQLQSQLRLTSGERTRRLDGWTCGPHDPEPWLVDSAYRDVAPVLDAVLSFVEQAGARASASPRFERQKPLLGVPLVGTGAGGGRTIKGDLIEALVRNLHEAASGHDVDIALVTSSEAARAAAIAARRRATPPAWPTRDPRLGSVLNDLAHKASQRHLVIFAGAGLGRGAGLPLWEELLEHLASETDLTADERGALKKLDEPDRAALLDIGLRRANKRLGNVVKSRLESRVVGLAHTLLATLPTSEVSDNQLRRPLRAGVRRRRAAARRSSGRPACRIRRLDSQDARHRQRPAVHRLDARRLPRIPRAACRPRRSSRGDAFDPAHALRGLLAARRELPPHRPRRMGERRGARKRGGKHSGDERRGKQRAQQARS